MRAVLESILAALVDQPDAVRITGLEGEKTCIFELRCDNRDLGKVIGKKGKTIAAIRTVLNAIASRDGKRALLEVVE